MLIEKIKNESVRVQNNMERIRKSKKEIMELEYVMERLKSQWFEKDDNSDCNDDTFD